LEETINNFGRQEKEKGKKKKKNSLLKKFSLN